MAIANAPFATFIIVGPTCFFLGILFAQFPYDYNVLWTTPALESAASNATAIAGEPYFTILENHLRFLHASPPLISRILHIITGTGYLGFGLKLYKMSESNMLFDGASLVLYTIGVIIYITNIVKGLRLVTSGAYGELDTSSPEFANGDFIGREDSLKVMAASNTILALVLVGVLVLQAGQWYAQKKEAVEIEAIEQEEKLRRETTKVTGKEGKKKQ